jgi:hypothetical protein
MANMPDSVRPYSVSTIMVIYFCHAKVTHDDCHVPLKVRLQVDSGVRGQNSGAAQLPNSLARTTNTHLHSVSCYRTADRSPGAGVFVRTASSAPAEFPQALKGQARRHNCSFADMICAQITASLYLGDAEALNRLQAAGFSHVVVRG